MKGQGGATPPSFQLVVGEHRDRSCQWCGKAIEAGARRDAKFCSKSCRQAAHRFHRPSRRAGAARLVVQDRGHARRFAYADPPYPGKARLYRTHPDYAGEVDHAELIRRLSSFDGWALSTSVAALPEVLALCPQGTRVAAWFRGERPTSSYSPLPAWEPVLYFGARRFLSSGSERRVDALVYVSRPRTTDRRRVIGAKPAEFCAWLFGLLGLEAVDELVDLFPGSGGVAKAWASFVQASRDAAARRDASAEYVPHPADEWAKARGLDVSLADPPQLGATRG